MIQPFFFRATRLHNGATIDSSIKQTMLPLYLTANRQKAESLTAKTETLRLYQNKQIIHRSTQE